MLVMGIKIHRTIVDTGSYTIVIFFNIFKRIRISVEYIRPCSEEIVGFAGSKVRPVGTIDLAVELGDHPCQKILITEFNIIDISYIYNAILGSP